MDFPINSMVIFHSKMLVQQRVLSRNKIYISEPVSSSNFGVNFGGQWSVWQNSVPRQRMIPWGLISWSFSNINQLGWPGFQLVNWLVASIEVMTSISWSHQHIQCGYSIFNIWCQHPITSSQSTDIHDIHRLDVSWCDDIAMGVCLYTLSWR